MAPAAVWDRGPGAGSDSTPLWEFGPPQLSPHSSQICRPLFLSLCDVWTQPVPAGWCGGSVELPALAALACFEPGPAACSLQDFIRQFLCSLTTRLLRAQRLLRYFKGTPAAAS
ncbi:hypothetical protein AAFF_G00125490 [Aldrovandia affinis]|uniref:Uncharacterized protein n=1 Tax=Aldrovandia affinis TaxID=143900 RepID=A0AAD7RRB5_9TELE|nr:hypothetical protein AAFF_G00125490 [Aldrovandia affinis]